MVYSTSELLKNKGCIYAGSWVVFVIYAVVVSLPVIIICAIKHTIYYVLSLRDRFIFGEIKI